MTNLALERAKHELQTALDATKLSAGMKAGLIRYVAHGVPPGSFLTHCIENNFIGACMTADNTNQKLLREFAMFMHWHMPPQSYGNVARRRAWCAHDGLQGLLTQEASHA